MGSKQVDVGYSVSEYEHEMEFRFHLKSTIAKFRPGPLENRLWSLLVRRALLTRGFIVRKSQSLTFHSSRKRASEIALVPVSVLGSFLHVCPVILPTRSFGTVRALSAPSLDFRAQQRDNNLPPDWTFFHFGVQIGKFKFPA